MNNYECVMKVLPASLRSLKLKYKVNDKRR